MSFIKKIIPSKKLIICDIGSYKIRGAFCEYKNNEIHILSLAEARQEVSDVVAGEIASIEGVGETLQKVISKLTQDTNLNPKDIIINVPTSTILAPVKHITYSRSDENEKITLNELDYVVSTAEKEALQDAKQKIKNQTGYSDVDMKLITSSIVDMSVDGFKVTNPLGFSGKNISLSLLNIFIPSSRYTMLQTLGSYIGKNLTSLIPLEFSLPKLLSYGEHAFDDVVFVDIGNMKSSIILQHAGVITGMNKIDIGMYDLIKLIKEQHQQSTLEIIKNLSGSQNYIQEKNEFLNVWGEAFTLGLKEATSSNLIPYNMFITGGGNTEFIKNHIKNYDFASASLHMVKKPLFISGEEEFAFLKPNSKKIFDPSYAGLLSMILASLDVVQYKNNPLLLIIKNFLEKHEFSS